MFKKIKKQTEMKPSSFVITPLKADYLEKQLAQMKVDNLKARHSDLTSLGRNSGMMTQASTNMNTTFVNEDDNDMPFAVANSVKHKPQKALIIVANNMVSPKSTKTDGRMRLSARKGNVTFESYSQKREEMNTTSLSFRNQELDKSINDHLKHLTRPKAEQEKDEITNALKNKLNNRVNSKRRSNLAYWDRAQFDQELKLQEQQKRHTSLLESTMEAHHLKNKFQEKLSKKRLNDSPIRRMKQL